MTDVNEKEFIIKKHLNTMLEFLIKSEKCTYEDALTFILGSNTYQQIINSELYLNQSSLYILYDLKEEFH